MDETSNLGDHTILPNIPYHTPPHHRGEGDPCHTPTTPHGGGGGRSECVEHHARWSRIQYIMIMEYNIVIISMWTNQMRMDWFYWTDEHAIYICDLCHFSLPININIWIYAHDYYAKNPGRKIECIVCSSFICHRYDFIRCYDIRVISVPIFAGRLGAQNSMTKYIYIYIYNYILYIYTVETIELSWLE